jgi:hypothetical protein
VTSSWSVAAPIFIITAVVAIAVVIWFVGFVAKMRERPPAN